MNARLYNLITTICMVVAVISALSFDYINNYQWVIGLIGVLSAVVAFSFYYLNHASLNDNSHKHIEDTAIDQNEQANRKSAGIATIVEDTLGSLLHVEAERLERPAESYFSIYTTPTGISSRRRTRRFLRQQVIKNYLIDSRLEEKNQLSEDILANTKLADLFEVVVQENSVKIRQPKKGYEFEEENRDPFSEPDEKSIYLH